MPLLRPFALAWQALRVWWDDWINQLLLNLVWVLCWLTVLLGPPATFAIIYGATELARGSADGLRGLAPVARRHFGPAWIWFGVNLATITLLLSSITLYGQMTQIWAFAVRLLLWLVLLSWLGVQFYTVPLYFTQKESSLRLAWRNGALLAAKYPVTTFVLLVVAWLILVFSLLTGIMFGLGGFALVTVLAAVATRQLLAQELNIELEPAGSPKED